MRTTEPSYASLLLARRVAWRALILEVMVMSHTHEKCIESVRVHLPERLKNDLQDLAAQEDRALSELIRVALEDWLYGQVRHICRPGPSSTERGR